MKETSNTIKYDPRQKLFTVYPDGETRRYFKWRDSLWRKQFIVLDGEIKWNGHYSTDRESVALDLYQQGLATLDTSAQQAINLHGAIVEELDIPEFDTLKLREYQCKGVEFIHSRWKAGTGALLADDMGLGKTVQALMSVYLKGCDRGIIFCPASVIDNWIAEVRAFFPPEFAELFSRFNEWDGSKQAYYYLHTGH